MVRKYIFILFLWGILLSLSPASVQAECTCPTSSLTVSPQVVQPGDPIKLTFPGDRANHIEDQTTGGLAKEAGHVDNTGGGSIHFQNGSNSWYIFHAGPTCGTYTWNHQSPGAGCTCNISAKFTVCGTAPPAAEPTAIPPLPTSPPVIPTATPWPTEIIALPTQTPEVVEIPTATPSRSFSIPTVSSLQITPPPEPTTTGQNTPPSTSIIPSFE